jgi:hypothetical protein
MLCQCHAWCLSLACTSQGMPGCSRHVGAHPGRDPGARLVTPGTGICQKAGWRHMWLRRTVVAPALRQILTIESGLVNVNATEERTLPPSRFTSIGTTAGVPASMVVAQHPFLLDLVGEWAIGTLSFSRNRSKPSVSTSRLQYSETIRNSILN